MFFYSKKITFCLAILLMLSLMLPALAFAAPFDFNSTLQDIVKGAAVAELQESLKEKGYYSGAVDGNLDSIKDNAIQQAKGKIGLPTIGSLDLKTIAEAKKDQLIKETTDQVLQGVGKKVQVEYIQATYPKITYIGQHITAQMTVKNTSKITWLKNGQFITYFTYRWLDSTGKAVVGMPESKVFLPQDIKPEELFAFNIETSTPPAKGVYTLQVNLIIMDSPITKVAGIAPYNMKVEVLPYGSDNPTTPTPPVVIPNPPVDNVATPGSYSISGRGFGHGVGMSQWGARGMAMQGFKYPSILSHYYQGTKLQTLPSSNSNVRVGVYLGQGKATISASGPYQIIDGDTQMVLLNGQKGDRWQVDVNGGFLRATPEISGQSTPLFLGENNLFNQPNQSLQAKNLIFQPLGESKLDLVEKKITYRGSLKITNNLQGRLDVINVVNMDDYLFGVVTKESPASWPLEALKAQAVASRSYALYKVQTRATQGFDVYDTTTSQVYGGFTGESSSGLEAVLATTGQILTYNGQVAETLFHANSGGYTESNENIWNTNPMPYLRAVKDEHSGYDTDPAKSRYGVWWQQSYTAAQIENAFNASPGNYIDKLISIDIVERYQSGRPSLIKVTGTAGTKNFTNSQFRRILDPNGTNLKSNWFEIAKGS